MREAVAVDLDLGWGERRQACQNASSLLPPRCPPPMMEKRAQPRTLRTKVRKTAHAPRHGSYRNTGVRENEAHSTVNGALLFFGGALVAPIGRGRRGAELQMRASAGSDPRMSFTSLGHLSLSHFELPVLPHRFLPTCSPRRTLCL